MPIYFSSVLESSYALRVQKSPPPPKKKKNSCPWICILLIDFISSAHCSLIFRFKDFELTMEDMHHASFAHRNFICRRHMELINTMTVTKKIHFLWLNVIYPYLTAVPL